MNYQNQIDANYYLARYNEILLNMQRNILVSTTNNNLTIDFIRCMIPLSNTSILMCNNFLKYINHNTLDNLSYNIINMEKNNIKLMNNIASTTPYYINTKKEINNYFKRYFKIVNNMINDMNNSRKSVDIIINFTYEMIPLYQGIIKLCENLLRYQIDSRLIYVVQNMIINDNNLINIFYQIQKSAIK